jgi:hypothetical protein
VDDMEDHSQKKSIAKVSRERNHAIDQYNSCLNFYGKDHPTTRYWRHKIKKITDQNKVLGG